MKLGRLEISLGEKPNIGEVGIVGTTSWSGFIDEEYNPDLKGMQGLKVYDRMRRSDGMVQAMLLAIELPLRNAEWYIEPFDNDKKTAEFITEALFKHMTISFDELLQHIFLMLPFGYSIFEKIFELQDGQYWWKKLAPRLPKTLYQWKFDDAGGLQGIVQQAYQPNGAYREVAIPVEKLLVFTHRREGSNYSGMSILRPAYKHWYIKEKLYKISVIGLERQAIGVPKGKLPRGYTTKDKEMMEDIVRNIRINEESGMVLPEGFDVEILKGEIESDKLLAHIKHHDALMAKSILAQFLQLTEGRGGSFALSRDQSDFFLMSLGSLANYICNIINRYAIPQLVDYNFTVQGYPKLIYTNLEITDKAGIIDGVDKLVKGQVLIPDNNLEEFMRNLLSLPQKLKEHKASEHRTRKQVTMQDRKWHRDLTRYEKQIDFAEIKRKFDTEEEKMKKVLGAIIVEQTNALVGDIDRYIKAGNLHKLYEINVRYRGRYRETLKSILRDLAEFGNSQVAKEAKLEAVPISRALGQWLTIKADTVADLHATRMRARGMLTVLNSLAAGKTEKAALFDVRKGIEKWASRELTATVGIAVGESINKGRANIVENFREEFQGAQFSAILDDLICPLCEELDMMVVNLDDPDYERFTPLIHWNCRCIWAYIRVEEKDVEFNFAVPDEELVEKYGGQIA
ncbi:MAG: hypothetical protein DDT42_00452 [candidate division WS2 bacterium]|uniref:Phage head morphogenesis domain-containing protein n=1 Tax=Psychracetigena formicireducens TaxID=2986056 RepID=A0A9E2BI74_PSYF1|nr:hypothetical protein [Candidatus Psychracetigena formicireducens]